MAASSTGKGRALLQALLIAFAAFMLAWVTRESGGLEKIDLAIYDRAVDATTPEVDNSAIALVVDTEQDIARLGYPLSDRILADAVNALLQAGATAILVDKYRDQPVPPGSAALDRLLAENKSLYWVEKFDAHPRETVRAPKAMPRERVGCSDVIEDPDGNVRRALVYLDAGGDPCYSLAFVGARHMLALRGGAMSFSTEGPATLTIGVASLRAIEPNHGPYANIDTAGFQVALRLTQSAARFATFSLSDVLNGKVPAGAFSGKLVFIGSEADSLRDFFRIPAIRAEYGRTQISGVALHAAIASRLIAESTGTLPAIQLVSAHWISVFAALLAVAGGLLAGNLRNVMRMVAIAALILALVLVAWWTAWRQGWFIAPDAPVLAFALAIVFGMTRRAYVEYTEKKQMLRLFGKHMSPELAQSIWNSRDECFSQGAILPQAIVATALFTDIRSFTTATEKLGPADTIAWLNQGLSTMGEAIMAESGVITRFAGDAIMALFGSPVASTSEQARARDAECAIRAALAIGVRLEALNVRFAAEMLPALRVRIGIQTGDMVQGSIGGVDRMEFTVMGDAVNTASRLESYVMEDDGAAVRILIGEPTYRMAGHLFNTQLIGDLALKGKTIPVKVYRVFSASTIESR